MTSVDAGFVVWLTGLPASGKTTTAKALQNKLLSKGLRSEILDGDQVRQTISPELGFSKGDRELHAKRVAYLSHLLSKNGIVVIVSLISPLSNPSEIMQEKLQGISSRCG